MKIATFDLNILLIGGRFFFVVLFQNSIYGWLALKKKGKAGAFILSDKNCVELLSCLLKFVRYTGCINYHIMLVKNDSTGFARALHLVVEYMNGNETENIILSTK